MAAARFDVREARRMPLKNEWLIVVDMQRAFADSPSPWAAPGFYGGAGAGRAPAARLSRPDNPHPLCSAEGSGGRLDSLFRYVSFAAAP